MASRNLRRRRGEGDLNYLFRYAKARAPGALKSARAKATLALSERKYRIGVRRAKEDAAFREEFKRKEAEYLAKKMPAAAPAETYRAKRIDPKTGRFY